MVITAKFPSVCPCCSVRIEPGSKVEWGKGSPAQHVDCGSPKVTKLVPAPAARRSAPRAPRGPAFPASAPEAGAHKIEGRRNGRQDSRYDVGQVVHAPKVSIPGGGPDKAYYVVLAAKMCSPNEDQGYYDWTECAWVRAATDEEAEAIAAERRRAAAPKLVLEAVVTALRAGQRVGDQEARAELAAPKVVECAVKHTSVERIALREDGTILGYHGGSYDDYRANAHIIPATDLLSLCVRALASGNASDLAVAADAVMAQG
jgi:hypothetical protein